MLYSGKFYLKKVIKKKNINFMLTVRYIEILLISLFMLFILLVQFSYQKQTIYWLYSLPNINLAIIF